MGLRLPPSIRFRPPRDRDARPGAADQLRDLPTAPRAGPTPDQSTPPPSTSAQRLGAFVESRRQALAAQPVETPEEPMSTSGQRVGDFLAERSASVAQQASEAQMTEQLQTAALAARLSDILNGGPGNAPVGEGEGEGGRLERLDMRSEILLRRVAVLLRKQAPNVRVS